MNQFVNLAYDKASNQINKQGDNYVLSGIQSYIHQFIHDLLDLDGRSGIQKKSIHKF